MQFSKMHGLSNDFMIVDAITQKVCFTSDIIRRLSNRYYGIGFDQLLIVEPPYDPVIDFHCRIYNANGFEVYQCGNGIRCVASFLYLKKLTNKKNIKISTSSRNMLVSAVDRDLISVNMGEPVFDPVRVPFITAEYQRIYFLFLPTQTILCGVVYIGNPHCVILVNEIESVAVDQLGSIIENHHSFPKKVNISFMQVVNPSLIRLRVYERGVGETQACGSAACAAVAFGIKQGLLFQQQEDILIQVDLLGGSLFISWKGAGYPLYMVGSATHIYDGYINI